MRKHTTLITLLIVMAVVNGCAHMDFYTDKDLKQKTGIKYYISKPYLLITKTGNKDKPIEASLIYLPDQSQSFYAKPVSGWGTADLSIAFNNGMITSFGQKTDSKIPETIQAVGSLVPGIGGSFKSIAEAISISQHGMVKQATPVDYLGASDELKTIAKKLRSDVVTAGERKIIPEETVTTGNRISDLINSAAILLHTTMPSATTVQQAISKLQDALKAWDDLKPSRPMTSDENNALMESIMAQQAKIETILEILSPKKVEPVFELYEIDNKDTPGMLRRVKISATE